MVKPKSFAASITQPKTKKEDLTHKIKKDSGPDMGSYEPRRSLDFLDNKDGPSQKWQTGPVIRFYEKTLKIHKDNPNMATYKVTS